MNYSMTFMRPKLVRLLALPLYKVTQSVITQPLVGSLPVVTNILPLSNYIGLDRKILHLYL